MRIGLARHFQIAHRTSAVMDGSGFAEWIAWYDREDAPAQSDRATRDSPRGEWDRCYSSDLLRARSTAGRLFSGEVRCTPLLREVPFGVPRGISDLRMPLFAWQAVSRGAWRAGRPSQPEGRRRTLERVSALLDDLCATHRNENVLLVTHGFVMHLFARELRLRGWRGRVPTWPRGGEVCVFESPELSPRARAHRAP